MKMESLIVVWIIQIIPIDTHITNLHYFLKLEKIKPPYVLVSHSIGALYALKFAQKYPKETKTCIFN